MVDANAFRGVDYGAMLDAQKEQEGSGSNFFNIDKKRLKAEGKLHYVIRFLPYNPSKPPIFGIYQHNIYNASNELMVVPCSDTIGQRCSICGESKKYYNQKTKEADKLGSILWKKKVFYANIIVISDPYNEENNGRVCRFRFGTQLDKVITLGRNPIIPTETPAIPFDIDYGHNLNLVVVMEDGNPKYSYSKFDTNNPCAIDESVFEQVVDLEVEFGDPSQFIVEEDIFDQINSHMMREIVPFNEAALNPNASFTPAPAQTTHAPVKPAAAPAPAKPVAAPVAPPVPVKPMPIKPAAAVPVKPPNPIKTMPSAGGKPASDAANQKFNAGLKTAKEESAAANVGDIDDLLT